MTLQANTRIKLVLACGSVLTLCVVAASAVAIGRSRLPFSGLDNVQVMSRASHTEFTHGGSDSYIRFVYTSSRGELPTLPLCNQSGVECRRNVDESDIVIPSNLPHLDAGMRCLTAQRFATNRATRITRELEILCSDPSHNRGIYEHTSF